MRKWKGMKVNGIRILDMAMIALSSGEMVRCKEACGLMTPLGMM